MLLGPPSLFFTGLGLLALHTSWPRYISLLVFPRDIPVLFPNCEESQIFGCWVPYISLWPRGVNCDHKAPSLSSVGEGRSPPLHPAVIGSRLQGALVP